MTALAEVLEKLEPKDIQVSAYPEPVQGGMHVGLPKGVKVTHIPTGITVTCDHERSQHKNRDACLVAIAAALHGPALLRDAGDARDDEWVLVPRRITGPATDLLANFDMDDVGNNRGDAAEECWAALVEQLSRPAPELKFSNPVFHAGTNLTVRRGTKWHREQWATVQIGDTRLTVRLSCMTHRFAWLTDHWVRDEHDPKCRSVAGLLAEMQRVYPGFSEQEEVTLVRFNVPAIEAAMHAPGGAGGGS